MQRQLNVVYENSFFTFTEIPEKLVCKFSLKFLLQNVSAMFTPQGLWTLGFMARIQ